MLLQSLRFCPTDGLNSFSGICQAKPFCNVADGLQACGIPQLFLHHRTNAPQAAAHCQLWTRPPGIPQFRPLLPDCQFSRSKAMAAVYLATFAFTFYPLPSRHSSVQQYQDGSRGLGHRGSWGPRLPGGLPVEDSTPICYNSSSLQIRC